MRKGNVVPQFAEPGLSIEDSSGSEGVLQETGPRQPRLLIRLLLKYSVPYRNRTRSGGQNITGHESEAVVSNSYVIK